MSSESVGVKHAKECWQSGFNCAESVLRGVCHARGVELPDGAKRMATPFGGGVGRSEDICGALVGGVLAIGAATGRTSPDEDKMRSYDAARDLFEEFRKRYGSTCCKVLNKSDFRSPEHRTRCGEFVEGATTMALQVLSKG